MTPPSLAHIQPDDIPRTPIQPSVEGEFRQHDGMVTMMMFYRCRASPKHRYDMIEVDYGGGGHRTRLRDQEINCCVYGVPPAPIYKGARGEAAGLGGGRAKGGVLLPPGVDSSFPCWSRRREGRRRRKEGGAPLPSPIRTSPWGGVRPPFGAFLSFPIWPIKAQYEFS